MTTSTVTDNATEHRFQMDIDGQRSVAEYTLDGDVVTFTHSVVPEALQGRGIGTQMVEAGLASARSRGLKVVPQCPMFSAYMKKHPETQELLAPGIAL